MCHTGKRECRYSCRSSEEKKRLRQGGDTGEGKLLNVGYLQDQDAEYAKRQAEKKELQKKKNEAKKEREFQAEC